MTTEGDAIAAAVLDQFDRLPEKRKPINRGNGVQEWVPLSGIVVKSGDQPLKCVALATGMKCLPASKIPAANGSVLHDWHAEVLAIRAFNHFLLKECKQFLVTGESSKYLRRRTTEEIAIEDEVWHGQPFAWRDDVTIHMYCSEAPCGDASMELTMAAQEDAAPWEVPSPAANIQGSDDSSQLPGRAYFSKLGVVRRKPARGDAPPTLSKSCSDKIALKQCTSLLSSLTSVLVSPEGLYISSLVLPESQYSPTACERCFSVNGRMFSLAGERWPGGYCFSPFKIHTTTREFAYSRRCPGVDNVKFAASNMATAWTENGLEEGIIGGILQGRKQSDPKGASLTSRRKTWSLVLEVSELVEEQAGQETQILFHSTSYQHVKDGVVLAGRSKVKDYIRAEVLRGWVRNTGDSGFAI